MIKCVAVNTMGLPHTFMPLLRYAIHNIICCSTQEQVAEPDAWWVVAAVENVESVGNRVGVVLQQPGSAMGLDDPARYPKSSISISIASCSPNPAAI